MPRAVRGLFVGVTFAMSRPCAGQDSTLPRPILYLNASGGHAVLADGRQTTLPGFEANMSMPAWAPTGARWAYARGDNRTRRPGIRDPAPRPSGGHLAYGRASDPSREEADVYLLTNGRLMSWTQ